LDLFFGPVGIAGADARCGQRARRPIEVRGRAQFLFGGQAFEDFEDFWVFLLHRNTVLRAKDHLKCGVKRCFSRRGAQTVLVSIDAVDAGFRFIN
jgi:hypothetical protein